MRVNNRGSYEYGRGITLTPFQDHSIKCLWRVGVYQNPALLNGEDRTLHGDYPWEESVAVIADTPLEAAKEGIKTYFRNKKPALAKKMGLDEIS